jgi:hypothetical protein
MSFPRHGWYSILTLSCGKLSEVFDEANPFLGYDVDKSSDSVSEPGCTSLAPDVDGKEKSFSLDFLNKSWTEREKN